MRHTLWTAMLVTALLAGAAYGQGMPAGRRSGRYGRSGLDDDRSPSMSRIRTSLHSRRGRDDRGRDLRGRRGELPAKRPVVVTPPTKRIVPKPPAKRVPPTVSRKLRPGVGSVPSGKRHADRGGLRDFLQLPGSGGRIVRPRSPRTVKPLPPRTTKPPSHLKRKGPRPSIYSPPAVRHHERRVYKQTWNRRLPFTSDWFKTRIVRLPARRSARYHPWRFDRQGRTSRHWWARATASALTNWLRHRWSRPVYYVYGSDGNVFYQDEIVYVDGSAYATSESYYQQARAIALSVPDLDAAAAARLEWLPLGVFAITRKGVAETNCYLQLAVTRTGIIGGTYFNEATGASRPVQGMVDKNTQRAAWCFADGSNAQFVVETSFYNLTQDEVPVLVHFGPERTQEGLLVRVEAPAEG